MNNQGRKPKKLVIILLLAATILTVYFIMSMKQLDVYMDKQLQLQENLVQEDI